MSPPSRGAAARPTPRRRGRSSRPPCAAARRTSARSAASRPARSCAGPRAAAARGPSRARPRRPARRRAAPTATDTLRTRPVASRSGAPNDPARAAQRDLDAVVGAGAVLEPGEREVAARVAGEARRRDPRVPDDAPRRAEGAAALPNATRSSERGSRLEPTGRHERDGGARAAVEDDVAGAAAGRGARRPERTGRRARGDGLAATRTGADPVLQTPTNQPSAAGDEGDRHVVDEGVRPRHVPRRRPRRRGRGAAGSASRAAATTMRRINPTTARAPPKLLRTGGRAEAAVRPGRRPAARRAPAPPAARRPTPAGARAGPG